MPISNSTPRGNIGNALTDNMMKDLGISQETVNTGTSLVFVGICIGDIPANLLIQKARSWLNENRIEAYNHQFGADIWLPCQLLAWGLVATFQAFIKNRAGFLSTRFLLGLCESGFIPGTLWYLTKWYTKRELGKRTVLFFIGSYTANLLNGLIAYGLLRLRGRGGLTGWQWLFLVGMLELTQQASPKFKRVLTKLEMASRLSLWESALFSFFLETQLGAIPS
jgi:MFS family permease